MLGQGLNTLLQLDLSQLQPILPAADKQQAPSVFDQAMGQYPILQNLGLQFKMNPQQNQGFLEFWPPGETGDESRPRPKEFDINKPGVEIYDHKTRPIDVLGDVTSHYLIDNDPKIASYYDQFKKSITPQQQDILQEQYQYARQNEGETRPYKDWLNTAGLPAYFRGYAFQQWPADFVQKAYTPQQIQMFNNMLGYLKGGK